jgi:hypothetical protein
MRSNILVYFFLCTPWKSLFHSGDTPPTPDFSGFSHPEIVTADIGGDEKGEKWVLAGNESSPQILDSLLG